MYDVCMMCRIGDAKSAIQVHTLWAQPTLATNVRQVST